MSEKPKTRAQLEAVIADLTANVARQRQACAEENEKRVRAEVREKQTREQFDDLKTRLAIAESDSQRMRGYISRVQEDDTVREDLIKVGDPEGEHQLVPKRKPTLFFSSNEYRHHGAADMMAATGYAPTRDKPKHWVTY